MGNNPSVPVCVWVMRTTGPMIITTDKVDISCNVMV